MHRFCNMFGAFTFWIATAMVAALLGAAGCDGGTPSGTKSTGCATSGGGSASRGGSGSGGGTTGPGSIRIVAWNADDVLPTGGGANEVWLFVEDQGQLFGGTLNIEVNGQRLGAAAGQPIQLGSGTGLLFFLTPAPSAGATIQAVVVDQQGNVVNSSNTINVKAGPFAQGNTPAGGFKTVSPADGDTGVFTGPDLIFTAAAQAASYQAIVFELGLNQQNQVVITDLPVAVEVAPAGSQMTFTVTSSSALTEFANSALANQGAFVWHVVALDATGWGIGTTIDVAGFNASGGSPPPAVSATWPLFQTQ